MSFTVSISLVLCHEHDDLSEILLFAYEVEVHALVWVRLMLMLNSRLCVGHAPFVFFGRLLEVRRPKPIVTGQPRGLCLRCPSRGPRRRSRRRCGCHWDSVREKRHKLDRRGRYSPLCITRCGIPPMPRPRSFNGFYGFIGDLSVTTLLGASKAGLHAFVLARSAMILCLHSSE